MENKKYALFLLVANRYGVLMRISGLFAKRGYNIDNLSVGRTQDTDISRMTVVVECEESLLEQIVQQLRKLIDVIAVESASTESVMRELMLIKISHTSENSGHLMQVINIFRGRVVDMSTQSLIVEITGQEDKLNAFIKCVEGFGIIELSRTGITALIRGGSSLLESSKTYYDN
ncbi:MAG: acetolactate synthase small subunit [Christensenellaceae bacterium]|jgi:acetolactate synthase-1/3 small subunit|nr:acetolactate synthase small subunit [Christensenellaceae bacterium]